MLHTVYALVNNHYSYRFASFDNKYFAWKYSNPPQQEPMTTKNALTAHESHQIIEFTAHMTIINTMNTSQNAMVR